MKGSAIIRPKYFVSQGLKVKATAKKGRGVFALKNLAAGRIIEVGPALLIPRREVTALLKSFLGHYIFRTDKGGRYVIGLGYTSLFNDSAQPNAEFFATTTAVTIKTLRRIKKGEEITTSYGWSPKEWAAAGGHLA